MSVERKERVVTMFGRAYKVTPRPDVVHNGVTYMHDTCVPVEDLIETRPIEVEERPLSSGANPWPALGRWMVGEEATTLDFWVGVNERMADEVASLNRDAEIFDPGKTGK